jgi:hypothetical protein
LAIFKVVSFTKQYWPHRNLKQTQTKQTHIKTAFAKMQFTEMNVLERDHIIKGLLKYCELDTLAMVMIYEFWQHEIKTQNKKI